MTSVLVTGANGFVGRHVARRMAKANYRVVGIGHGSWTQEEWCTWALDSWHSTDINIDALITYGGEPDIIIHCAGSGSVAFSVSHPYQDFQRTVQTTLSVLEYVRIYNPNAIVVLPSSAGVYGLVQSLPITVRTQLNPISPYGVHKKQAEEIGMTYARHFGLKVAAVRLFSIYGSGLRKQLLWDACRKIWQGDSSFSGTGRETRDWLHINDAVELIFLACRQASKEFPIANGGAGDGIPIKNILAQLTTALGRSTEIHFSGDIRRGDPPHYVADLTEAKQWGWSPTVDLCDGLNEYAIWFRGTQL